MYFYECIVNISLTRTYTSAPAHYTKSCRFTLPREKALRTYNVRWLKRYCEHEPHRVWEENQSIKIMSYGLTDCKLHEIYFNLLMRMASFSHRGRNKKWFFYRFWWLTRKFVENSFMTVSLHPLSVLWLALYRSHVISNFNNLLHVLQAFSTHDVILLWTKSRDYKLGKFYF